MAEQALGLVLDELAISLPGRKLLELSLRIAPGEVVAVMGPSGSGKSTLLAAICGTLDPAFQLSGRIFLDGRRIEAEPPERRRVGILFQDDLLFPHLSVGGNLAFGLPAEPKGRAARRARIDEALAAADLDGLADRDPATLSGGQRARISLLRALLSEPRALLLDEPFSRLDTPLRARFRGFVLDELRRRGLPGLLATHDATDAAAVDGKVVTLGD
ncbi:putative thiamine transport system ATP-binding protein [Rhizobiales bacterium GAS191]|jgi:putative thiamine transport system ATP-binding protein|nr:putative thiamine transport system ATP-binding protein [Rhizobiales bacterium GAS113]SED23244.1 putative thiamine transport system ATP-binding protein [Rhizobiales bacterium GAS191]